MSSRYKQSTHFSGVTRFTQSPMAEVEFSRMTSPLRVITDMNAGDIVPVLCLETLPMIPSKLISIISIVF